MLKNPPDEALFIKKQTLLRFAQSQNTPFFLYDEKTLRKKAEELSSAFSVTSFKNYVPVSVNPNPHLLSILRELHFGVWCENEAELALCSDCGFFGEEILFASYISMPEAEELAFSLDATFVVQAAHCFPSKPVRRVVLSYKPQERLIRSGKLYTGFTRAKQGFSEQELLSAAKHFTRYGAESVGLMLRTAQNEQQSGYLAAATESLYAAADKLYAQTGIKVRSVNLGGGLYCHCAKPACTSDVFSEAAQIAACNKPDAALRIEATIGKWLLSPCGIFVTKIAAVYPQARPLLITEAAASQLPDCSLLSNPHEISVLSRKEQSEFFYYDICGSRFEHRKNFAERKLLPSCGAGDYLIFHDTGAGCRVRSMPLYGDSPCPEFLLTAGGNIEPI